MSKKLDKITVEFSREEILMLQELTENADCGFEWLQQIADGLHEKLSEIYPKPVIRKDVYDRAVEQERGKWKGMPFENIMVMGERRRLKFFYRVEG